MKRALVILLGCIVAISAFGYSYNGTSWWNTEYPTTMDTLFYVGFMRNRGVSTQDQANATMFLYATAFKATTIKIENPNTGWSKSFSLAAGFQSNAIAIPITECYPGDTTGIYNTGLKVSSTHPISLYATNHNSGSYDGTNIYPVTGLEKEHVVQTYMTDQDVTQFAIVPAYDCSSITINVKKTFINHALLLQDIYYEDSIQYEQIVVPPLRAGQVYFYRAGFSVVSLAGTTICADVPIAVFNGGQDAEVPYYQGTENHLFAQAYSTDQLGKFYVVTSTHGQNVDYVRITGVENGTTITRNGVYLTTINARETYQDTLSSPDGGNVAWIYETSHASVVNLYATDWAINGGTAQSYGAPVLSPITSWEQLLDSCLFATFPANRDDNPSATTNNINVHYVNIVVRTASIGKTRLDGQNIASSFSPVPANPSYSFAEIQITQSLQNNAYKGVRITNPDGFTARVYGMGVFRGRHEAYAYSAGSRIARSADFLIDDQYVKSKTICVNDPSVKFTSLIQYDYDDVRWEFHGKTDSAEYRSAPIGLNGTVSVQTQTIRGDSIIRKKWDENGTDTVYMIVKRSTPLCNHQIYDTIRGLIYVRDTFHIYGGRGNVCYGDTFTIRTGDKPYTITADTTTVQTIKPYVGQRFKLNTRYEFVDSLYTREGGCDSIVHYPFIIRPTYEYYVADTICENELPYTYINNKTKLSNLRPTGPYPSATDYLDDLHTRQYGCDSFIHLHLVVYPHFYEKDTSTICTHQDYRWLGKHFVGQDYPDIQPGDIVLGLGLYKDSVISTTARQYSCDSIYKLELNVIKQYKDTLPYATCKGHPINIPGLDINIFPQLTFDSVGRQIYTDTFPSTYNCDSLVTWVLDVYEPFYVYDTLETCWSRDLYDWRGKSIDVSKINHKLGPYQPVSPIRDSIVNTTIHGCDSIYYLYLTVHQIYDGWLSGYTICDNERHTWYYGDNKTYVGINAPDTTGANGHLYGPGVYTDSIRLETMYGCDSIRRFELTVNSTYKQEIKEHVCTSKIPGDSLLFEGIKFPLDRVASYDTIKHLHTLSCNCDSIIHLHVDVDSTYEYLQYDTVCQGTPYTWVGHERVVIPTNIAVDNITYTDYDTTIHGCDSLYNLRLTILPSYRDSVTRTISEEDTCVWQGVSYGGVKTPHPHDVTVTRDTVVYKTENTISIGSYTCDSILILRLRIGKVYRDTITDSVCQNATYYEWKSGAEMLRVITPLPDVGTTQLYRKDTVTALGFDSLFFLKLTTMPSYVLDDTLHACQNESFIWHGHEGSSHLTNSSGASITSIPTNHAGSFVYYDNLTTIGYECDSIWCLHLIVDSVYEIIDTLRICENDSVSWQNVLYTGFQYVPWGKTYDETAYDSVRPGLRAGTYFSRIRYGTVSYDCDSVRRLMLIVSPVDFVEIVDSTCRGNEFYYRNLNNGAGGYLPVDRDTTIVRRDTLQSVLHCDSVVKLTFHVYQTYEFLQNDIHLCQNPDSIWVWMDENNNPHDTISLATVGSFLLGDRLKTIHQCDSLFGIRVIVDPIYNFTETLEICENDSISWQKVLYTGSKYSGYGGTFNPDEFDSTRTALAPGTYYSSIRYGTVGHDCDSIHNLILHVYPLYDTVNIVGVCDVDMPYAWQTKDRNGVHVDTIRLEPGVEARWLSEFVKDTMYRTLTKHLETIHGCDSAVTLQLTIHPSYAFYQTDTVCQNRKDSLYDWIDDQGHSHAGSVPISIAHAGTYEYAHHMPTVFGCDSAFGIRLLVTPSYLIDSVYNICQSEAITWQGKSYAGNRSPFAADTILVPDTYYDTVRYTTSFGCDSIYALTLHVHPIYEVSDVRNTCDNDVPYVWRTTDHNGTYTDTIRLAPGTVAPMLNETEKDTLYRTHTRMLESVYGCDSLVTLQLTIYPTYFYRTDTTICSNEKVLWHGRYFSSHDTICTDHLYTAHNCDSIYQLRLHVQPAYLFYQSLSICDNETVTHNNNGIDVIWKPGNVVSDTVDLTYFTEAGCDSVYRYFTTIYPSFYHEDSITLCSDERYPIHDHLSVSADTLYAMGQFILPYDTVFVDSLNTIHGCDSVYRAFARIYPSYRSVDYDTICANESATWRGHTYEDLLAGNHIYYDSLQTIDGCDSIYELRLCVHSNYFYELHETICDEEQYNFNGRIISDTVGVYFYTDSLQSAWGCDSVYHLYLTINPSTYVELYDTFCLGDKYYWPSGVLRAEPGVYVDTLTNEYGCNQYTTLYLERIEPTRIFVRTDTICADDGDAIIHYTYKGLPPIAYTVRFDSTGHAQGFEDVVWQPLSQTDSILYVEVPIGEILPHPNPTYYITRDDKPGFVRGYNGKDMHAYVRPNKYPVTVFLHNGVCSDSLVMDSTQLLNVLYPDWIHEQHWNDAIVLYNEIYNGGYVWSDYQWYKDGKPLPGQVEEYYYNPQNLDWGHAYQVRLTREDDGYSTFTCPIYPDSIVDYLTPKMDYVSVVPTLIFESYPVVNILSTEGGTYTLHSVDGRLNPANMGRFYKNDLNATEVRLVVGDSPLYIMTMTTDSGYVRRQKIVVLKR